MDMEKRRASQRAYVERNREKINQREREYKKGNTKSKTVNFYQTDMALYEYAAGQDLNFPQYVKRLIREDMERNGVPFEPKPRRNRWDNHEKKED